MIDQIGGWATAGVGQKYGEGYKLDNTMIYMITLNSVEKSKR
jgi:hypothetical protein